MDIENKGTEREINRQRAREHRETQREAERCRERQRKARWPTKEYRNRKRDRDVGDKGDKARPAETRQNAMSTSDSRQYSPCWLFPFAFEHLRTQERKHEAS